MVDPAILGPIDVLAPVAGYLVFVLVLANFGTRYLSHQSHVRQVDAGADTVDHYWPHELMNILLLLAIFYYASLHQHQGIILGLVGTGMVVCDFFEFEARCVEARQNLPIEQPKGAIAASIILFLYAGYASVFFVIAPIWNAII